MLNLCIRVVCLLSISLIATPALSQGMSGWSDKTVCRLVSSQQDNPQFLQEAKKRELACAGGVTKTQNTITTKTNSSSKNSGLQVLDEHEFECMYETFDKFVNVFGIYVAGTNKATIEKVLHTAGVFAQYLDNDEDGLPDDPKISSYLSKYNFIVPVWSEEDFENFDQTRNGTPCQNISLGASMYIEYDKWAIGGIQKTGQWDTNLEEVWHIVSAAWYEVYPKYFGGNDSLLLRAMNKARGGIFDTIPSTYPKNAWYAYYDETCDYSCQSHEYFYWILMANINALDPSLTDKCKRSSHEWNICNKSELKQQDALAYELLNEYDLVFPTQIPNGQYRPAAVIPSR